MTEPNAVGNATSKCRLTNDTQTVGKRPRLEEVGQFLDLEAEVSDEGEEDDDDDDDDLFGDDGFIDDEPVPSTSASVYRGLDGFIDDGPVPSTSGSVYKGLAEGQDDGPDPDDEDEDEDEDVEQDIDFTVDELEACALQKEKVQHLLDEPKDWATPMWYVRTYDKQEQYTVHAMYSRLEATPSLAISVVASPAIPGHVAVESASAALVEALAQGLTSVPAPPRITFIPLHDHSRILSLEDMEPNMTPPVWVRLCSATEMRNRNIEPYMYKYARDLALLHGSYEDGYGIILIPRLPVKVPVNNNPVQDDTVKKRTRYLRRLLHLDVFDPLRNDSGLLPSASRFLPDIYWHPAKPLRLEYEGQFCKFAGKRRKERYFLPFVAFTVSGDMISARDVRPTKDDLNLFFEGMVAGVRDLDFHPPPPFWLLRATYQRFFGTPVELGERVIGNTGSLQVEGYEVEGVVKSISDKVMEIADPSTGLSHFCSSERVSRLFSIGDTVKVMDPCSPHRHNEGWVIEVGEDKVTLVERENLNEVSVFNWQVSPCDMSDLRERQPLRAGDRVRVVSPISPHFGIHGRLLSSSDQIAVVVEQSTNTQFSLPPWFLEPDTDQVQALVNAQAKQSFLREQQQSIRGHDKYQNLVNARVQIVGQHPEKGLHGRVSQHRGNKIMRVELESGARVVDVHVNFLLSTGKSGVDVSEYHDHGRPTYGTKLVDRPQPIFSQPNRPGTPLNTDNNSEVGVNPNVIRFGDVELRKDWLMHHDLVNKRIWVHVRNSAPEAFSEGFADGKYEGSRAMVMGGESLDKIDVLITKGAKRVFVPSRFLFPQQPSAPKQSVAVLRGDYAGQVFVTHAENPDGWFPLFHHGSARSGSVCVQPKKDLVCCEPPKKDSAKGGKLRGG